MVHFWSRYFGLKAQEAFCTLVEFPLNVNSIHSPPKIEPGSTPGRPTRTLLNKLLNNMWQWHKGLCTEGHIADMVIGEW